MVRSGPNSDSVEDVQDIAQSSESIKSGWEQAIHDMRAMAEDREDRGYDTIMLPAGDTAPKNPQTGETNEYGLSYVIPDSKAEPFLDLYEGSEFTDTGVYQTSDSGHVHIVTECIDLDSKVVVFVGGSYQMRHAPPLVRTATSKGKMYTHIKKLDTTHLGTFEHDDVSAFFPNPKEFYAYETNR